MKNIFELSAIGIMSFISTNLDDFFLLTMFFSIPGYRISRVVTGQYLGILTLTTVSSISLFAAMLIPVEWIGLMGILPIAIGIRGFIAMKAKKDRPDENQSMVIQSRFQRFAGLQTIFVALVCIANGGDNIGIYIPLFVTMKYYEVLFITFVFMLMTGVWCFISFFLVYSRFTGRIIAKVNCTVLPVFMVILGIYIMYKSGTLKMTLDFLSGIIN